MTASGTWSCFNSFCIVCLLTYVHKYSWCVPDTQEMDITGVQTEVLQNTEWVKQKWWTWQYAWQKVQFIRRYWQNEQWKQQSTQRWQNINWKLITWRITHNNKWHQCGRTDEHGTIRHRLRDKWRSNRKDNHRTLS